MIQNVWAWGRKDPSKALTTHGLTKYKISNRMLSGFWKIYYLYRPTEYKFVTHKDGVEKAHTYLNGRIYSWAINSSLQNNMGYKSGKKSKHSFHFTKASNPFLFLGQSYMWQAWIVSNLDTAGNIAEPPRFGLSRWNKVSWILKIVPHQNENMIKF